jgi:hypothetical protein
VATDEAIGRIVVTAEELDRRVRELGAELSRDREGRNLLLLGILKGAVLFLSDLLRQLQVPAELDFMAVRAFVSVPWCLHVIRVGEVPGSNPGARLKKPRKCGAFWWEDPVSCGQRAAHSSRF